MPSEIGVSCEQGFPAPVGLDMRLRDADNIRLLCNLPGEPI